MILLITSLVLALGAKNFTDSHLEQRISVAGIGNPQVRMGNPWKIDGWSIELHAFSDTHKLPFIHEQPPPPPKWEETLP